MNEIFCFLGTIGMPELIVIFVILLLFFGAKRLPELAKGLGKSVQEFKKASTDMKDSFDQAMKEEEKKSEAAKKASEATESAEDKPSDK